MATMIPSAVQKEFEADLDAYIAELNASLAAGKPLPQPKAQDAKPPCGCTKTHGAE